VTEASGWPGELTPADVDVVAEPAGSVAAALAWAELVLDGRIAESWAATGPAFRRHLARHWAWNHRFALHSAGFDPLEVADGLADAGPVHPLWPAFARSQQVPDAGLTDAPGRAADGDGAAAADRRRLPGWVAAGPPEPVGPDLEVVRLAAAECAGRDRVGPPLTLVLRFTSSGWQVEGHGHAPAPPGWPPGR
jgi:hypothetical protein